MSQYRWLYRMSQYRWLYRMSQYRPSILRLYRDVSQYNHCYIECLNIDGYIECILNIDGYIECLNIDGYIEFSI